MTDLQTIDRLWREQKLAHRREVEQRIAAAIGIGLVWLLFMAAVVQWGNQ